jgi:hypothetical protein
MMISFLVFLLFFHFDMKLAMAQDLNISLSSTGESDSLASSTTNALTELYASITGGSGGFVVLGIIGGLIVFYYRRKKLQEKQTAEAITDDSLGSTGEILPEDELGGLAQMASLASSVSRPTRPAAPRMPTTLPKTLFTAEVRSNSLDEPRLPVKREDPSIEL